MGRGGKVNSSVAGFSIIKITPGSRAGQHSVGSKAEVTFWAVQRRAAVRDS